MQPVECPAPCVGRELKAENMVKLPLRVIVRHPSQRDQLLVEAIFAARGSEKIAVSRRRPPANICGRFCWFKRTR